MNRKMFYLSIALIFGLMVSTNAATIIWVSEWMADAGGVPFDQGWIDLLRTQGYIVEADTTSDYMTLDASKIAALEAADLIIVSRNSNSGNYDDEDEVNQWNSITTPIILQSSFLTRSNRWQWLNSTSITELSVETMLRAVDESHPVFSGVTLADGQINIVDGAVNSGQGTFIITTDVGNGILIAQRADDNSVWIVEWKVGEPFYSETTQTPGGKRMLFTAGGGGGQTAGALNLNENGKKMFLNSIRYMIGMPLNPGAASIPNPANGEVDVFSDMVLSWTPGGYADKHNVYFGTVFDDVNEADTTNPRDVLVSPNQAASTYKPAAPLEFGQTYYWRVDEVNAPPTDTTVYKGDVWSFTVEPFTYPLSGANITATASSSTPNMGPDKTIDDSGLTPDPVGGGDQHSTLPTDMWLSGTTEPIWIKYEFDTEYKLHEMWVWNSNQSIEPSFGFGLRNVTIEYSTDDNNWTQLDNVPEFRQGTGLDDYTYNTTVNFNGVVAKYVRITAHGNWGGILPQCSLSEVRFFHIPTYARKPQPASQAIDIPLDVVLSWRPGRQAALHEVYFSSDRDAVIEGTALVGITGAIEGTTVAAPRGQNTYIPGSSGLELGKVYYWKINEVNEAEIPAVWQGEVWSFTTQEFLVVEDFESYDDTCDRIFYAWVDGFGHSGDPECSVAPYSGNVTGSTVGNLEAPFAERSIVHEGRQSMPFEYNNADAPYFSETQHQWDSPQDWTTGGANSLTLHFQGSPPPFIESPAGVIIMGAAGTDIWDAADEFRFAWKNLSGNGSIIARVESIVDTDAWAKAGVMIRNTLSPGSRFAAVYLTGDNGVRFHSRAQTNQDATSDTSVATSAQTALREPVWIKLERSGDDFYGYYATDEAGTAWTPMVWNPQTIDMLDNVYIGLAVTSHSADVLTAAKFTNVSMTGTVTGQWQVEEVGVTQPGGNEADLLYVILRDSADRTAVVVHSDAEAVLMPAWMEWNIPLAEFSSATGTGVNPSGINLQAIKEMYIGVGNKNAPQPSGAGKLYIDDIRLY